MDAPRISRTRIGAAVGLVAVLAVGLIVTSGRGHERPHARVSGQVPSRKTATANGVAAPPSTVISDRRADEFRQLNALIPDRSDCQYDPKADIPDLQCAGDGVVVDYFLLSAARVTSSYLDIVGPNRHHSVSEASPCATGREDERGWATAAQPRVTVGRFSCRMEHSRPTMWWVVPGHGLIARAVMTTGNLAQLFEWWNSHSERWVG